MPVGTEPDELANEPADDAADDQPLGSSVEPPPLGVGSSVELGAVLSAVLLTDVSYADDDSEVGVE